MADVKDILGIARDGGQDEGKKTTTRTSKAPAIKAPAGMSREAFALLDQSHPIMPSVLSALSKKSKTEQIRVRSKWKWRLFTNPARKDDLKLYHWEREQGSGRKMTTMGLDGEYVFSKYNKKIMLYRYDDVEYRTYLNGDPSWTREETDYLLDMCERFDLRFVVIADRYQFKGVERQVDDLKARYYDIARKLIIAREGSEKAAAHDPIVKNKFNITHEKDRKRALEIVLSRSATQEREERAILQEAAEIEARRRLETSLMQPGTLKVENEDNLMHECTYGLQENRNSASLCSATGILQKPAFPGVYARRKHTKKTAAEILAGLPNGQRNQKLFEGTLAELGVPSLTAATQATCTAWIQLHVQISELLELKKGDLSKGPASVLAPVVEEKVPKTPKTATKIASGVQSKPEPIDTSTSLLGGRQRRDVKRKTPSRYDDMAMIPPRAESKRTRTK